jgi:hypothetical protein
MQGVGVLRPLQQVVEEVEQRPTWTDIDIKVAAINRLFGEPRLRERCDIYVRSVYKDTYENRKAKKALRNQLLAFLKQEMHIVRNSIQVHQYITRKRAASRRARGMGLQPPQPRAPTAYAAFCRRMHETRPHNEIVGKLQELWRKERNLPPKVRKREQYHAPEPVQEMVSTPDSDEKEDEAVVAAQHTLPSMPQQPLVRYSSDSDSSMDSNISDYR